MHPPQLIHPLPGLLISERDATLTPNRSAPQITEAGDSSSDRYVYLEEGHHVPGDQSGRSTQVQPRRQMLG